MDRDLSAFIDWKWGLLVWWNCYADKPSFLLGMLAGALICTIAALVLYVRNPTG